MFYYFGAKHRVARKYQPPKHGVIVEPFAGSGAYSCYWLEKHAAERAIMVELDPRVVELWNRILTSSPSEIEAWPTPILGQRTDDLMITIHGGSGALRATGDSVITPFMVINFPSMRRRIAAWVAQFGDRIEVIEGDYRNAPDIEATWFIDPPYQHQGHQYNCPSTSIDYAALGEWSKERKGQTIVCEADPADWLPFRPFYRQQSIADTYNTELVWESDPTPTLFD